MRLALAVFVFLFGMEPTIAASPEGLFVRNGKYPLFANIIETEGSASYAGRFMTGHPGDPNSCGGTFAATGRRKGDNKFVFIGDSNDGEACQVTMAFNRNYTSATITSNHCSYYHGASCDFDGDVKRTGSR